MAIFYSYIKLHYLYINNAKYTVSNKSYVNMKSFIRMLCVFCRASVKVINIENAWCDPQTLLK